MAVTLGFEVLFRKKAGYQAFEKHVNFENQKYARG